MIPGTIFSSLRMRRNAFPSVFSRAGKSLPVRFPSLLALAVFAVLVAALGIGLYFYARQSITDAVRRSVTTGVAANGGWGLGERLERDLAAATPVIATLDTLAMASAGAGVFLIVLAAAWVVERNRFIAVVDRRRRETEERLRASQELFRQAFEHAPVGMALLDVQGRILAANPAICRLGYSEAELAEPNLVGKTDHDVPPRGLAEKYERDSRQVLRTGDMMDVREERMVDGEPRVFHDVKAPVRNGRGEIIGVLGVLWDITAARRDEMRLEDLSHRLVAAQEDERRRLATQLHERLSPNLAAIKILLSTLDASLADEAKGVIQGPLQDAHALLDDATADVRCISADLRPMLLDYAGLIPALHGYAAQFVKRTNVAVHVSAPEEGERLDAETESTLFRIAQEALTNCARHACAKNIHIDLRICGPDIVLSIKDDGFGFDMESLPQTRNAAGAGLMTMKERAEFAGGRFTLCAHPLVGTEIKVELPQRRSSDAVSA